MKSYLFLLMLAPTIAFINPDSSMNAISKAISAGDAEQLSKYFDSNVEVAVLDNEDVYDVSGAKKVISDFFTENKPKSFNAIHQGTSKGKDSQYVIGNLVAGGTSYRVYLYMKVNGSSYLIQELRFDEE